MDYIKISKKLFHKYLSRSATIYVQSTPHFLMEGFIFLVALILTVFQHVNISNYSKKILRLKPHTVYCKNDRDSSEEKESTSFSKRANQLVTTVSYKRGSLQSSKSQLGWILSGNPETAEGDKKRLSDEILALTPEQFVLKEKERRLREKELGSGQYSLSTLCQIAIKKQWSDTTFKDKLNTLKENLECNSSSLEGAYLGNKTGMMTESLLCMLENLITNSSVEKPLPFKGNITTLALDAAELVTENRDLDKSNSQTNLLDKKTKCQDPVILKSVNWNDVVPQSEEVD